MTGLTRVTIPFICPVCAKVRMQLSTPPAMADLCGFILSQVMFSKFHMRAVPGT